MKLANLCRRAYEIKYSSWLRDQQRRATLAIQEPTTDQQHEIQVFDFFNFPYLPERLLSGPRCSGDLVGC